MREARRESKIGAPPDAASTLTAGRRAPTVGRCPPLRRERKPAVGLLVVAVLLLILLVAVVTKRSGGSTPDPDRGNAWHFASPWLSATRLHAAVECLDRPRARFRAAAALGMWYSWRMSGFMPGSPASPALLSAALCGLLGVASTGCSGEPTRTGASTGSSGPVMGSSDPDAPIPATECDGGVAADPQVTSSMVVANVTLAQFTGECTALAGILEIQPHCGGSNACRGMSYDSDTQTLIEHSCRATNSCAGFSCVVCD